MPGFTTDQPESIVLPKVDVRKVLEQDRENDRRLPRFGIKIPIGYTENDGTWYETGRMVVWKIRFFSNHATALSFQFEDLILPKGSEMWLYSEARNMVMGPILPEYIHNGILPTDQIFGEEVTISVKMPATYKENFTILVRNVIHGIDKGKLEIRDYGDSENCNVNIICSPEGDNWQIEKDAVCKIFVGTAEHCTGALVNNDCNDLTPYILTANHCVAAAPNLENWVFRFKYESPNCIGSEPTTWLSFFGADLRASWNDTDFALLELQSNIIGFDELALAGWDRSNNVPTTSTLIHHPEGDVRKISFDADAAVIDPSPPNPLLSNRYFRIEFTNGLNGDFGLTEPGSSGAPHFNNIGRIVGNHSSIINVGTIECSDVITAFEGRFHSSWIGGGNNNNQLSHWLGGNGNPVTTNTIRVPSIVGAIEVCPGDIENYTLQHPIPGRTVTWQVSPASAATISSGSGSSANISWENDFDGYATLTFSLAQGGCNIVGVPIEIRVGTPRSVSQAYDPVNHTYVSNPKTNIQYEFHALTPFNSSTSSDYSWSVTPPAGGGFPTLHAGKEIDYTASVSGFHLFELKINGYCGWSSMAEKNISFTSLSPFTKTRLHVFPNPSGNVLEIEISRDNSVKRIYPLILRIYSSHGQIVYEDKNYHSGESVSVVNIRPGIYKLIIQDHKNTYYDTFVKN